MKNLFSMLFKPASLEQLRQAELDEAQRDLRKYEAVVEYRIAMRDMLAARVKRLESEKSK